MSSGRCGLCGNKFGQRAEETVHADCVEEMNRKYDRLREELASVRRELGDANSCLIADRAIIAALCTEAGHLEAERDRLRERVAELEEDLIDIPDVAK